MDKNKLKVLQDIEYEIPKVCGLCWYSDMNGNWGQCSKYTYKHKKHKVHLDLSISTFGSCSEWKEDPVEVLKLHQFKEFIK